MADRLALVEDRLTTAAISYPFRAGWLDDAGVALLPRVTSADVADWPMALLDPVEARALVGTHVIIRDIAVSAQRATLLTLATATRPDEIAEADVSVAGVSPAGRAVAAIVVPAFYGISVSNWTSEPRPLSEANLLVQEDALALIPIDDDEAYQEDLGRAWFLFTDTPFVSHVCIARRDLIAANPDLLRNALRRLIAARDMAQSRGRELRRNLSSDLAVEREVLTDALAEQSLTIGAEEQRGLEELWKRSGRPLTAAEARSTFVSLRSR